MLVNCIAFLGQSNAITWYTSPQSYPGGWTPDANFKIWTGAAWETYDPGANTGDGGFWGPEAGYIKAYKANHKPQQSPLYIVKHAIGSCGLAKKGAGVADFNPYSTGTNKQYPIAFNKITGALNSIQAGGLKALVPSVFVVNGETDSLDMDDADAYYSNMDYFAEGIRSRMWVHNARFIITRIQDAAPNGTYRGVIRDAQDLFGTGSRNATVDTDDLTLLDNHFDPASVIELGERMYWAEQGIV